MWGLTAMYNWQPGEMLFAMECCGDLLTLKGKMMRFVLRYLEGDTDDVPGLLSECDLSMDELTEANWEFIENEIRSRSPSYIN